MTIPITGLVELFGASVLLYLSGRFYSVYKKESNLVARIFSYGFFCLGLCYFVSGLPALFFIKSPAVWKVISPVNIGFVTGGWLLVGFSVISQKFPKYSKVIAILFLIFFITSVLPFLFQTPTYFYIDGVLDWTLNFSGIFLYMFIITYYIVFLFGQIVTILIFFGQAKRSADKRAKIRSLGLGLALSLFGLSEVMDFFIITILKVHPVYCDLNYLIMFSTLALTLLFTWFPARSKYVTKIE